MFIWIIVLDINIKLIYYDLILTNVKLWERGADR